LIQQLTWEIHVETSDGYPPEEWKQDEFDTAFEEFDKNGSGTGIIKKLEMLYFFKKWDRLD
jgi:hypothetical protein